jgi:hypothetical protein
MKARGSAIATMVASGLCAAIGFQSPAWAVVTAPCAPPNSSTITTNMGPINGGNSTYCQTAFGWSDAWFPTMQPGAYDGNLDVLSGDNAPSLTYTLNGQKVGTGNIFNFLSPFLDGGTLVPQNIGGGATVLTPLPVGTLPNPASSLLQVGDVTIGVTTTVNPTNSVTEAFKFTNISSATVTGLTFDDYFNFHPDGSNSTAEAACGATAVAGGVVTTVGKIGGGCSLVALGTMSGALQGQTLTMPNFWDVGNVGEVTCTTPGDPATCTTTPGVLAAIAAAVAAGNFSGFNNGPGSLATFGDTGADLVWDLPNLSPGASETFTITKNGPSMTTPMPEPGSLALLGSALFGFGLGAVRRRRRRMS